MARRAFIPRGPVPTAANLYTAFIGDLLDGKVRATALIEQRDGQGRTTSLQYDEPAARIASAVAKPDEPNLS